MTSLTTRPLLLSLPRLVPDTASERAMELVESSRIRARSKVIFGVGDLHRAVTITANHAFLRAAAQQGVHFAAFCHPARALTEAKAEAEAAARVDS